MCYAPCTFGEEGHIDQLVHDPPDLVFDVFVLCILKRFGPNLRLRELKKNLEPGFLSHTIFR